MGIFNTDYYCKARAGATEKDAIDRLISAAEKIAHEAVWCSLSMKAKVSELRAPLAELKLARRKMIDIGE